MAGVILGPTRGLADFSEHTFSIHLAEVPLKDRFVFSPGLGWMEFDGVAWTRHADKEGLVVKSAIRYYVAEWIRAEVVNLNAMQLAALATYLKASGLDRLERMLKTVRGVLVPAERFDADPWKVNTPSGILDLLTGTIGPHDPRAFMTRLTGASYSAGASHPDWIQALLALPDDDTRRWLQAYLGRGLLGHQGGAEYVPFLIGTGSNGKSLVIGACLRAIGTYGGMVADELLAGKAHEEHVMRLRGLRLAVVEELADGHRLNVARMKQILGTDRMIGRHLYQSAVEWPPSHTLAVTTNYMPLVPETDHGTWRRLKAVPFPTEFAPDDDLKQRVLHGLGQQAAVLAWLVEGALMPVPPPSSAMEVATSGWRMSVDLVAQFLDECCEQDVGGRVSRSALLDRFNEFATNLGNKPLTGRVFTERFKDHKVVRDWGVTEVKVGGVRSWSGLSIVAPILGGWTP